MMAMTTSSSISVNPVAGRRLDIANGSRITPSFRIRADSRTDRGSGDHHGLVDPDGRPDPGSVEPLPPGIPGAGAGETDDLEREPGSGRHGCSLRPRRRSELRRRHRPGGRPLGGRRRRRGRRFQLGQVGRLRPDRPRSRPPGRRRVPHPSRANRALIIACRSLPFLRSGRTTRPVGGETDGGHRLPESYRSTRPGPQGPSPASARKAPMLLCGHTRISGGLRTQSGEPSHADRMDGRDSGPS